MDLFRIYKDLVKETLLFKSIKGLTVAKRVLCIIVLSPFIALYTVMLLVYGSIVTLYRMFNGHLNFIHDFIKNERGEIRHATEAVVYWVAFPWIFVCKVLLAIMTFVLMFVHFSTSLVGYIATFGGIRFSPFMLEPVERFKNKDIVKHNTKAVLIFIIIGLILLSLSVVLRPICDEIYDTYKENAIVDKLMSEVKRSYDNNKISIPQYNEFVTAYNAGMINGSNYQQYADKYVNDSSYVAWDTMKDVNYAATMALVQTIIVTVYSLFIILYVSIYNNVGMRKKYIEHLSKEPTSAE